jgi:hypothetical protein
VVVGAVLVVLVGLAFLVFGDRWKASQLINQLSSRDQAAQRIARDLLRRSTDPATDDLLLKAVADNERGFGARLTAADLLLDRNRLMALEDLGRRGDLMTRAVVLARLSREGNFRNEIVPDPAFQVEATVRAWLGDTTRERRYEAIRLALELELSGVMDAIRPLLDRPTAEGAGSEDANLTLIAAAEAVARHKDCASAEKVALLADGDKDIHVRLRTLEVVERLAVGLMGQPPLCPGSLSEERLLAIVRGTLDAKGGDADFQRNMRIKGLGMIERNPVWLGPTVDRVRETLAGSGNGAERRAALAALIVGKDAAIASDLPRHFHDRDFEVRSTATQLADLVEGLPTASLWIGILRDESDPRAQETMRQAHMRLRQLAGQDIALPARLAALKVRQSEFDTALRSFLVEQLNAGQADGLTREAWMDAWFRWFAGTQGVSGDALEQAMAARKAMRAAMDRKDVNAFRAALDGAPQGQGGLWAYERGWLAANAKP